MKPSIPRGTRDFGPAEMQKRDYVFEVIRKNFLLFGFESIQTPAIEKIVTLTGKYGEEGDQLIFKILNSRIHESKNKSNLLEEFKLSLENSRNSLDLTEKALRYDLTVPFARFVSMNQAALIFPFKRYQIQPVWRADKPQKGRYREFYQCDADVIGSNSLINELEMISLIDTCFFDFKLPVIIKINNRKILTALAEEINEPDKIIEITTAIDKIEKIGKEGVVKELLFKGISEKAINKINPILDFNGTTAQKIKLLLSLIGNNEIGKNGIEELQFLINNLNLKHAKIELDITLARGLNYYTGTIFEVKAAEEKLTQSILGGGRYDNLTEVFGLTGHSGVGISFGIDRIYDLLEVLNLFPDTVKKNEACKVLFTYFDQPSQLYCLSLAEELRKNNISCIVYPDQTKKLSKQFDYANKKNIPFVCTIGANELATQLFSIKNMSNGKQQQLNLIDLINYIKTT